MEQAGNKVCQVCVFPIWQCCTPILQIGEEISFLKRKDNIKDF